MASASALAARPATIDTPATAAAIAGVRDACEKLELAVFRTQMLVLLEKIVDRLQKEKALGQRALGRRPGGLPDRQKYLHKVSDSHPEKSLRADAYQMVDALLDLVWPVTNANGTERARKSRGGLSRDERIAKRKADHDAAFEAELEASSAAFEAQLQADEAAFEARLQTEEAAHQARMQAQLAAAPSPQPQPCRPWQPWWKKRKRPQPRDDPEKHGICACCGSNLETICMCELCKGFTRLKQYDIDLVIRERQQHRPWHHFDLITGPRHMGTGVDPELIRMCHTCYQTRFNKRHGCTCAWAAFHASQVNPYKFDRFAGTWLKPQGPAADAVADPGGDSGSDAEESDSNEW